MATMIILSFFPFLKNLHRISILPLSNVECPFFPIETRSDVIHFTLLQNV